VLNQGRSNAVHGARSVQTCREEARGKELPRVPVIEVVDVKSGRAGLGDLRGGFLVKAIG
jgi:hypothetical protein